MNAVPYWLELSISSTLLDRGGREIAGSLVKMIPRLTTSPTNNMIKMTETQQQQLSSSKLSSLSSPAPTAYGSTKLK